MTSQAILSDRNRSEYFPIRSLKIDEDDNWWLIKGSYYISALVLSLGFMKENKI
jgi:hypothetical protein